MTVRHTQLNAHIQSSYFKFGSTPQSPFLTCFFANIQPFSLVMASLTRSCWERPGGTAIWRTAWKQPRTGLSYWHHSLILVFQMAPSVRLCRGSHWAEWLRREPGSAVERMWRAPRLRLSRPSEKVMQSSLLRVNLKPLGSEHGAGPVWAKKKKKNSILAPTIFVPLA